MIQSHLTDSKVLKFGDFRVSLKRYSSLHSVSSHCVDNPSV